MNLICTYLGFAMKPVELQCYCMMNTLLLKARVHNIDLNKNENSFAEYALKEIKELLKTGSVSASVKNYFVKHINPKGRGFANRWRDFYHATDTIYMASKLLDGKTDVERLEWAAEKIAGAGVAVAFNARNEVVFSDADAEKLHENGCFIVTFEMNAKSRAGFFDGVFSVYYNVRSMQKLTSIIDFVQMAGFGVVLDKHPYKIQQLAVLDLAPYRLMTE